MGVGVEAAVGVRTAVTGPETKGNITKEIRRSPILHAHHHENPCEGHLCISPIAPINCLRPILAVTPPPTAPGPPSPQNYLATQPLGCYRYSPCSCVLPLHPCNPSRNEGRYRRCSLKREAERCYRLLEPPSYRARLLVLCLLSRFLYGLAATARAASYLYRAAGGVGLRCGARSLRVCRFTSYPRARILWNKPIHQRD